MNKIILEKLDEIEKLIMSGNYKNQVFHTKEWAGADVIICNRINENIKKWMDDNTLVISQQNTKPQKRVIVTSYSKELSWLFEQLKITFIGTIDYTTKYDFYGNLAASAIKYLEKEKNILCEELLKTVLQEAKNINIK